MDLGPERDCIWDLVAWRRGPDQEGKEPAHTVMVRYCNDRGAFVLQVSHHGSLVALQEMISHGFLYLLLLEGLTQTPHTSTIKAIKSEFFHYDKNNVNVTLSQIQSAVVESLNKCASLETFQKLGATLHYIIGKGDWKWRVEFLQQPRYYGKVCADAGLCPRCYANKHNWLDVTAESFNQASDIEAARDTACGPGVAIRSLSGWHPDMEIPDVLHTIYLGTGRDLTGSLCMQAAEHCFAGATWDERLNALRKSMQNWCVENGLRPSTIPELRPFP